MCGIAGFVGQFDETLLIEMGKRLAHRGPDDAGHVIFSNASHSLGLIHQRLSIIDLTADGRQPMTVQCPCCQPVHAEPEHRLWITYNGELYNYKELRQELERKGHQFQRKTDTEVLLHLYAEEGPAMLKKLNGIFAFALFDGRKQGQKNGVQPGDLLLARDGVGTKPLYYVETKTGFLFASELKAFLAWNALSRDLDLTAIHYYLAYLWCPGEQTALRSVKKCQPGEALLVRDKQIAKRWFYYDYPYGQTSLSLSEKDICDELDARLSQAVARQLMSDVPVGAFLSGGLDSSAIVASIKKQYPHLSLPCYTIGFNDSTQQDGQPVDLPYAKKVAAHCNVNLNIIDIQADMMMHLDKMLYHLDEPQADPAPINTLLISEAARRDGVKVLLSGAGGDDIFSGYRRHYALHTEKYWSWLPVSLRKKVAAYSSSMLDGKSKKHAMKIPFIRRLSKVLSQMDQPMERRMVNYFMWNTEQLRRELYTPDMRAAMTSVDTAQPLLNSLNRIQQESDPLNQMLYLEGKHFLADHNLNYTDKMSMAAGVEVRVPLLDPDVIALATRIPSSMKQKNRLGKAIFKKAMEPYLPHDVIYRPKAGFSAPLRQWLHRDLQPLLHDVFSEDSLRKRNLFDVTSLSKLMKLDQAGKVDASYTLFSVLCIEQWCRIFVDK